MNKKANEIAPALSERKLAMLANGQRTVKVGKISYLVSEVIADLPVGLLKKEKAAYYQMLIDSADAHHPIGAMEWFLVHDIAMLNIQLSRFRQAEAGVFLEKIPTKRSNDSEQILSLSDFRPRLSTDVVLEPISPPPPEPKKKRRRKVVEPHLSLHDMGQSLITHVDVLERAQVIVGEIARRRAELLKQLQFLQAQRRATRATVLDISSKATEA